MKILYVAKHGSGGNDDEGAIHYALTALGHDVQRVREVNGGNAHRLSAHVDFCLFHKWEDTDSLVKIRCPKVFWYFDLVDFPDPTLYERCERRKTWMRRVTPLVDLGFCTDGDWAGRYETNKLGWLPQGADERLVGRGEAKCHQCGGVVPLVDLLFTGSIRGGEKRESFVAELRERYGVRFKVVERGVHGRAMADLIATAKIIVAPDGPVTDRYWSNRVYNVLGFGGFLLHPYCDLLTDQYGYSELCTYQDRQDLHLKIEQWLGASAFRASTSEAGLRRTMREHLYRHRCAELVATVKERLKL